MPDPVAPACPACGHPSPPPSLACEACRWPLDPALRRLVPGATFAGRYELIEPVGLGGFGCVFKARDKDLGEVVALKVLQPSYDGDWSQRQERFRAELKLARRVRHRNVCSLYNNGEDQGLLYICLEYVDGRDLRSLLDARGLPPTQAFAVVLQIAEGLQAIHEAGIVHRDLKPANILVDARGVVRLMDFGIAKDLLQRQDGGITGTSAIGSPDYMSPEQIRGKPVGFRTDVYALGLVVCETFTGRSPLRGNTVAETLARQLNDVPDLGALEQAGLPPALRPVLARAVEKNPEARYATVAEMLTAIRASMSVSGASGDSRGVDLGELPTPNDLDGPTVSQAKATVVADPRTRVVAPARPRPHAGARAGGPTGSRTMSRGAWLAAAGAALFLALGVACMGFLLFDDAAAPTPAPSVDMQSVRASPKPRGTPQPAASPAPDAALAAFARLAEADPSELARELRAGDGVVRAAAARALALRGQAGLAALDKLLLALRDPEVAVRAAAADALGALGENRLGQVVLRDGRRLPALSYESTEGPLANFIGPDGAFSVPAGAVVSPELGRLRPDTRLDRGAVAALQSLLADPVAEVRVAAATALGRLGGIAATSAASLDRLASRTEEPADVRAAASEAAARIRRPARR